MNPSDRMENVSGRPQRECVTSQYWEELIRISTFVGYRHVMLLVRRVVKEAHNAKKRRQNSHSKMSEEAIIMKWRAKTLVADMKRGRMMKEEIETRLKCILCEGSAQEIESARTSEKIVERIEISKTEERFEGWDNKRREATRKQRDDGRLSIFWRKIRVSRFGLKEKRHQMPRKR